MIVEVDESKFAKRKYNRGRATVMKEWVLGGRERGPNGRMFAVVVSKRDADTMRRVLSTFIARGSIIYSDCWRAYNFIDDDNRFMGHRTVNHSIEFVGEDGVHTNTIEGQWNGIKLRIKPQQRKVSVLGECLFEQIWRRKHINDDLWEAFMILLKDLDWEDTEEQDHTINIK